MNPKKLTFVTGYKFMPGMFIFGVIIIVVSVLGIWDGVVEGYPFLLLGIAMLFNFSGVVFDLEKNTVKPYTVVLGFLKLGKKHDLARFPYMTFIRMTYSGGGPYEAFEVHLMTQTHLTKILIQKCRTVEKAQAIAAEISRHTRIKLVKFDPRSAGRR